MDSHLWFSRIIELVGIAAFSLGALAQSPPGKPIRIVSGAAAASGNDLLLRIMAPGMTKALGQNVLVDPMPGASGAIAARFVARSAPDGSTLLMTNSPSIVGGLFLKDPGYDIQKDFAPISIVSEAAIMLLTTASAPWTSMNEMVAYAKANPNKLNAALPSPNDLFAIYMHSIRQKYGINVVDIYYKNGTAAMAQAIQTNEAQLSLLGEFTVVSAYQSKYGKALATTGKQRLTAFPDVPTFEEIGLPHITGAAFMLFGVAGTQRATIDRINAAVVSSMQDPEARERLQKLGLPAVASPPEALAQHLAVQLPSYAEIARVAGIRPE